MTPANVASERPLLDKLGVRPGMRVSVLRVGDQGFASELADRGADVSTRARSGSDLLFLRVQDREGLARLGALERSLRRDGAIWVIYPKGRKDIREVDVIRAGVEAGYVDNKIVRFSDSHTAMRLVIPLSRR